MKIPKPMTINATGKWGKWRIDQDIHNEFEYSYLWHWKNDCRKGLHCSNCHEEDERYLLSNSNLPRVLCIRCFALLVKLHGEVTE